MKTASPAPEIAVHTPHVPKKGCGPVAKSKSGKKRAAVLITVHVAFLVHLAHWKRDGWNTTAETLSPVEPSEAMEAVRLGYVNAGFVFFAAALLATLLFGRFFCGWMCHVVAYQDLCGALMRKFGVRPKPFRSRFLVFVPLVAGLYMFAWPAVHRLATGGEWPTMIRHFTTKDFWATFPGPIVGVMTLLICGPLIVWFLGNKGYCTYGCPYGGLFGVVDQLAPVRIRATDACEGCGHCTVVCTSNVRVHEEVALYKAVVDPACMKCLDCVSVCPKDALYVGFGPPAVATKKVARKRSFDFTLRGELALVAVWLAAFYAFRGLYEAVPFLLALGLASIAAFAADLLLKIVRRRPASIQNLKLTDRGAVTKKGYVAAAGLGLYLLFGAHSLYVEYHDTEGRRLDARHNELVAAGQGRSPESIESMRSAVRHYEAALDAGLVRVHSLELAAGRYRYVMGDFPAAIRRLGAAAAAGVAEARDFRSLAHARLMTNDGPGALKDLDSYIALEPADAEAVRMREELKREIDRR